MTCPPGQNGQKGTNSYYVRKADWGDKRDTTVRGVLSVFQPNLGGLKFGVQHPAV